ncbi:hypothetical protein N8I77_006569 [Diaporthe amygdali]|uniref:DNA (cytosine-5-)-methyltransferase n=1 Tax=Phomopsis amygdali TaxID=1214568 RepID=A0AAD9W4N6_PHOAM|nr:hypothetical protein N8I77_006569 [Diaporthe amygdali]
MLRSWSRCGRRVTVQLHTKPEQAASSPTTTCRAGSLNQLSAPPASCLLQNHVSHTNLSGRDTPLCIEGNRQHAHVSGLTRGRRPLGFHFRAVRSQIYRAQGQVQGCSHAREFSSQAKARTIEGPTYMETFAGGIGGFGIAATKRGLTCVYANENDPCCVETYERNHCRGGRGILHVDSRPVETVTYNMYRPGSQLPIATILFGGFPCPSFSNNGKKEGFDSAKYGHHLYEILKMVIRLQNPVVILENVSTFATNEDLEGIEMAQKEFEAAGYQVRSKVYKAVDFNLPQNRKRCFIVAVRKDLATGPFKFKEPPGRRQDLALTDFLDPPTVIENPSQYTLSNGVWVPNSMGKNGRLVLKWDARTLEERTSPTGIVTIGQWLHEGQTEENSYKSGRMVYHHSGIASCLITGPDNWYQVPGPDGKHDIIRRLSLREKLRIQGIPEDLRVLGNLKQVRQQIGNSVAPPIVEWIIASVQDQYPAICTSAIHSTTDVWPYVQQRYQDPEKKALTLRKLNNMAHRKQNGRIRREKQRAMKGEDRTRGAPSLEDVEPEHTETGANFPAASIKQLKALEEKIEVLENMLADLKVESKRLKKARDGPEISQVSNK